MKPSITKPVNLHGREFGGSQPLFCIPLVAADSADLLSQAQAARELYSDLVEWRADFSRDLSPAALVETGCLLRKALPDTPIIFTLRVKGEGGAQEMPQAERQAAIEAVLRSRSADIVDLELGNAPEFLSALMAGAKTHGTRVILSFHDFHCTPSNDVLLAKIEAMRIAGADIAKIAVMPCAPVDALRLLEITALARKTYPDLPLAIMSMGAPGAITRVAGFLYGSDMTFAVGKVASAPGQIPLEDARRMTEMLLRYA